MVSHHICKSHQGDRSRAGKEKEELDRAIALSLAEDLKRPNGNFYDLETSFVFYHFISIRLQLDIDRSDLFRIQMANRR